MISASARKAPDENTVVSWLVVTFWSPVVENADTTMNRPRRIIAGRSENSALAERDAATTTVITSSQMIIVRISMSPKNDCRRPFHTSAWITKLTEPKIMSSMRSISMGIEL